MESRPEENYHPLFSPDDCDDAVVHLTLRSNDIPGILFLVPRFVLRKTSGYFSATLGGHGSDFPIPIDEPASLLALALCILCGIAPSREGYDLEQMANIEALFALSQRWDAPALASHARDALTSLTACDPIAMYALSTRAGWDALAQTAAQRTLTLSIFNFDVEAIQAQLQRVSAPALLRLFALHRRRRDLLDRMLRRCLSSGDLAQGVNKSLDPDLVSGRCSQCGEVSGAANALWGDYCTRIFREMDTRPLGDTVLGPAVDDWSQALACWSARCASEGCEGRVFEREKTLKDMKLCIDALPTQV